MSGLEISVGEREPRVVGLVRHGDAATVTIDGRDFAASLRPAGDALELTLDDRAETIWALVDGDTLWLHAFGRAHRVEIVDPAEASGAAAGSADVTAAPMPGTVIRIEAGPGDAVAAGQTVVVIESMKMQSEIIATRDGVIARIHLEVGDTFDRGAPLLALEPVEDEQED